MVCFPGRQFYTDRCAFQQLPGPVFSQDGVLSSNYLGESLDRMVYWPIDTWRIVGGFQQLPGPFSGKNGAVSSNHPGPSVDGTMWSSNNYLVQSICVASNKLWVLSVARMAWPLSTIWDNQRPGWCGLQQLTTWPSLQSGWCGLLQLPGPVCDQDGVATSWLSLWSGWCGFQLLPGQCVATIVWLPATTWANMLPVATYRSFMVFIWIFLLSPTVTL